MPGPRSISTLSGESPTGHVILDRFAIIETKAGARLTSLDRQLHRHGHRALKMSKYGVGMAATVPGLPPEKWSRNTSTTDWK